MFEFVVAKIILSFKFIFIYQLLRSFIFFVRDRSNAFYLLDYVLSSVCIVFRYLIILLSFSYLPFVLAYFFIYLGFNKEVSLAFSKKYYDESRIILLFFVLFVKIPMACAKYSVYLLLKLLFQRRLSGSSFNRSFLINLVFVNIFGSPRWLFNLVFSLSNSLRSAISIDLSSKSSDKILFIRFKLCIDAINSCLSSECVYFVEKCNESKIYLRKGGLVFNMKSIFSGQNFKNVSFRKGILRAFTNLGNDDFREHPLYDPNYESGSSDGYPFTHFIRPGQKAIALKSDIDGDCHCMVTNNLHSENMIGKGQFKGLKQDSNSLDFLKKISDYRRYNGNDKIFFQDSSGSRSIDKSYSNLSVKEARELGLSDQKIRNIDNTKKGMIFESEAEKDLFENSLNRVTNADLGNSRANKFEDRIDTRRVPKDEAFKNLSFKDQVIEMTVRDLLLNHGGLSDEELFNRNFGRNTENFESSDN